MNKKVRKCILVLCQEQASWSNGEPTEDTRFYQICGDSLDFMELIMECEKELSIKIEEGEMDEDYFETVKDFIDWVITFLK